MKSKTIDSLNYITSLDQGKEIIEDGLKERLDELRISDLTMHNMKLYQIKQFYRRMNTFIQYLSVNGKQFNIKKIVQYRDLDTQEHVIKFEYMKQLSPWRLQTRKDK